MSELRTNRIVPRDGLPSGSSGGIIQIKQTVKTDLFSTSTTGDTLDVTGVSVTITPTRSDSKIFVMVSGYYGNDNNDSFAHLFLARSIGGGTVDNTIAIGDARGSSTRATMGAALRNGGGASSNNRVFLTDEDAVYRGIYSNNPHTLVRLDDDVFAKTILKIAEISEICAQA